ncbi:hypothetical protein TNCV_2143821 [Trichonephila clavipes]|nr:hypothetical protein TNCV_2143821 [Trichonephila clavipes]
MNLKGIIETVLETEKPTDRAVFYLPHQAVFPRKPNYKMRIIVFDASSHEDGQPSLNDYIWPGIPWDVVHDYFTIDVKGLLQLDTSKPITKLCFNQLGKYTIQLGSCHLTPIRLKCLLEELWLRKLFWDDELPPDIHAVSSQWWLELPFFIRVEDSAKDPRFSGDSSEVQIEPFPMPVKRHMEQPPS